MNALTQRLQPALKNPKLLPSTVENLTAWLEGDFLPLWAVKAIEELVEAQEWDELNDRFFKRLAFGTGGMRGRTLGKVGAPSELGTLSECGTPEHAGVGTNLLNDFNIVRATAGFFRYTQKWLARNAGGTAVPKLVVAHDVRHFSRHFCELCASVWTRLGGEALIFEGPRSTPQLSYSVRRFHCHAGVVITASHNPAHDNGYKAYFGDGAQVVSPHAEGIIAEVDAVALSELPALLDVDLSRVRTISPAEEKSYLDCVVATVLDPDTIRAQRPKIVYTPVHGTGQVVVLPALRALGLSPEVVEAQMSMDPCFPTVKSPNPENPDAFALAAKRAEEIGADVAVATDPDDDRVGIAVPTAAGGMRLLTGNMTGCLLLEHRLRLLRERGVIPQGGSDRVAVIKTFVTTPMQDAIAKAYGVKVINTLTGFKWIGARLRRYEDILRASLRERDGLALDYDAVADTKRRELLLERSTYFAFGGEESYGYLASDLVRDKDGNSAVCLVAELAAALKRDGISFEQYLDRLYLKYGYYLEDLLNIYYEGATGAAKIRRVVEGYRACPPKEIGGVVVTRFTDFGRERIVDADGVDVPRENFYFLELANGWKFAVRGSGTEPKVKFYLFARADVADAAALPALKQSVRAALDNFKRALEADARARAEQP